MMAHPAEIRTLIRLLANASRIGTGAFMLDYHQNMLCRIGLLQLLKAAGEADQMEINPFANEPPAQPTLKSIAEITKKYWPEKETAREASIRRRDEFAAHREAIARENHRRDLVGEELLPSSANGRSPESEHGGSTPSEGTTALAAKFAEWRTHFAQQRAIGSPYCGYQPEITDLEAMMALIERSR